MKLSLVAAAAASLLSSPLLVAAQNYVDCNPTKKACPPSEALGGSVAYDMTSAPDGWKTKGGTPQYTADGADFIVAKQGDSPTIISNFHIMFGRFEITLRSARGKGIVSSAMLLSDAEDEIDWELLGDDENVQSNWFRLGNTGNYDREQYHTVPGHWDNFNTYGIDWTPDRIEYSINGNVVRTLVAQELGAEYPQTPMHVQVGPWAGGDPDLNSPGTVEWAHGPVDYSQAPFVMSVRSIKVTDYSTGKEYVYTDNSGTLESIEAVDGQIYGNPNGSPAPPPTEVESSTPPADAPTPSPSKGTPSSHHPAPTRGDEPPATLETDESVTSLSGLPSSWIITTDTGKATEPSSASETSPPSSSLSRSSSASSPPESTSDAAEPTTDPDRTPTTLVTSSVLPPQTVAPPASTDTPGAGCALRATRAGALAACLVLGLALF
ncbi:hypothetical protein VTO42DRAFT_7068 [Malbranchea cinnamomea]